MLTKSNDGSASMADDDMDEAPILTDAEVRDVEVFEGNTFIRRGPGRPPTGNAKELVSVRLSRDVVAKLREAGPGWQSQVDTLLRRALELDAAPATLVGAKVDRGQLVVARNSGTGQMMKRLIDTGGTRVSFKSKKKLA